MRTKIDAVVTAAKGAAFKASKDAKDAAIRALKANSELRRTTAHLENVERMLMAARVDKEIATQEAQISKTVYDEAQEILKQKTLAWNSCVIEQCERLGEPL